MVFLADRLAKPVLVEGPAGTGKTELAKSVAGLTGSRLIRLQCYEGLDESKALYEWNYKKQLLRIQADSGQTWQQLEEDIFSEEFLLARPLLEAIRSPEPVVLLVDEVDRVELETEALLLEVLSEYQVSIPELGTVRATQIPLVFLTSNNTRELSEALKRRCLYLHIDYPELERERAIIVTRVPGISQALADQVARIVRSIRTLDLKKAPSVSETLDWARTLVVLGVESIDAEQARDTLHILLKYQSDIDRAAKELAGRAKPRTERRVAPCSMSSPASSPSCGPRASRSPSPRTSTRPRRSRHVPLEDREAFKYTLGATLVKSSTHWRAFETAFEVYFSLRGARVPRSTRTTTAGRPATTPIDEADRPGQGDRQGQGRGGGGGGEGMTPEELADMLYRALLGANDAMIAGRGPPGRDPLRRHGGRAGRSAAPTTSTGRCGTSTSTGCWSGWSTQARATTSRSTTTAPGAVGPRPR